MTIPPPDIAKRSFLIAARAMNGVIGAGNRIPWKSSGDMAHFRRRTMGCAVIMGRATWDSLPGPLVGREVIVVTSRPTSQTARFEPSFDLAIERALSLPGSPTIAFAGGRRIYEAAMRLPWLQNAFLTEVHAHPEGDVLMPDFGPEWENLSGQMLPRSPNEPKCVAWHLYRDLPAT